jgi:HTH-type transcriptional regulator / antitoxin HipB
MNRDEAMRTCGVVLRQVRRDRGLSQHELARRAGTRQSTISRVETGREVPTVERLRDLLLVMGMELVLDAAALDPGRTADDVAADRAKTMTRRLEEGFALATFAAELAGAARQ